MHTPRRVRVGMLTPSSNSVLEPLTAAMVAGVPGVTAHFSRFPVTEISLGEQALGQFDDSRILEAATLLAHAKVDAIAWNGTSGGWLGLEADERLCARITAATGIPATTSVLAIVEIMRMAGYTRLGFVTPYLDAVQEKVIATYRKAGFDCVAERHLGKSDNFSFCEVSEQQIRDMVAEVAAHQPQAITTFCTNMRAAHLAAELEQRHGAMLLDTVSTALWKALRLANVDTRLVQGWGRLFQEVV